MLGIKFQEAADLETAEAIAPYEAQEVGLGTRLRSEIEKSIARILHSPLSFPVIQHSYIRRVLLDRFPYSIIFMVEDNYVVIVAVFHSKRDPSVWQGRVD